MHTTEAHKWKRMELPLEDVRERPDFQMRVGILSQHHVRKLAKVLESGGDLDAISVAKVGKAHYVVDGFHRLQAARSNGWSVISANVATMTLPEASDYSLLANTKHGKGLKPKDKAHIFQQYVKRGKHLDELGSVKSSRAIAAEINYVYSHETVRQKLRALGVELDMGLEFPGGHKPYRFDEEVTEAELAAELAEEAHGHLTALGSLFFTLEDHDQRRLLAAALELVGSLERGERPTERFHEADEVFLDI